MNTGIVSTLSCFFSELFGILLYGYPAFEHAKVQNNPFPCKRTHLLVVYLSNVLI